MKPFAAKYPKINDGSKPQGNTRKRVPESRRADGEAKNKDVHGQVWTPVGKVGLERSPSEIDTHGIPREVFIDTIHEKCKKYKEYKECISAEIDKYKKDVKNGDADYVLIGSPNSPNDYKDDSPSSKTSRSEQQFDEPDLDDVETFDDFGSSDLSRKSPHGKRNSHGTRNSHGKCSSPGTRSPSGKRSSSGTRSPLYSSRGGRKSRRKMSRTRSKK